MDNFFNNEPKILKLIFTVRIYISYTCTSRKKIVDLKTGFKKKKILKIYRSQTDYNTICPGHLVAGT